MSAGFTPGPWQSKHDYTIDGATTIIANVDGEMHSDGQQTWTYEFICTCEDEYGDRSPRSQANARLIAAAPELFEAAQAMIDCLGPDGYFPAAGAPKTAALRRALAKARGDQ